MKRFRVVAAFVALVVVLPAPAFSRQANEDQDEIEQGREADKQIEAQFGFYDDPELSAYISGIGDKLATLSERPTLPWTFRVLDSPVVNAFALPGGFVYVTRGLVAYAGSEAELAGVIGHEIGHVTGRHSRGRRWGSILATIGILAGAVVSDTVANLVDLGLPQLAASLVLTKYSRGQELDADKRGIRYATLAGYNPYGIGEFFETLQSLEERSDRKKLPGWISTHPQVDDRIARSTEHARQSLRRSGLQESELFVGRRQVLAEVDGLLFGENPREGYIEDGVFLHPDLRFRVAFPEGWSVENGRNAVVVSAPDGGAYIRLELVAPQEGQDPYDYVRDYMVELNANVITSERTKTNDLDTIEAGFTIDADGTRYSGVGNWISFGDRLYQLLGVSTPSRWRTYSTTMQRSMSTFGELRDPAALAMEPARVTVVEVYEPMLLAGAIESYPNISVTPETVAILNHLALDDLIDAGDAVKLVFGGPGRP